MSTKEQIGQHLMLGIEGSELTPEITSLFKDTDAGALILFRRNVVSAESLKKLIGDLEQALGRRLLVAIDHEGGRVLHLAEGFTAFPDNMAIGRVRDTSVTLRQGVIEARELRRLGIDLNLAPTLDVMTAAYSPNIGIRSYGSDAKLVANLGVARIKGMQSQGLSACAKHFPGQGQSNLDAHLDLPVLETKWSEIHQIHGIPFTAAIEAGVHCVMSSHPVYPCLGDENVPATFSKRIIQDYLRKELGFDGCVISDDLVMGALEKICDVPESTVRAVEAGHDMVIISQDAKEQRKAHALLIDAYDQGRLQPENLAQSLERMKRLQQYRKLRFESGNPESEEAGTAMAKEIAEKALWSSDSGKALAFFSRDQSISVVFPRLSELSDRFYVEPELYSEKAFVETHFKENGIQPQSVVVVGLDPSHGENLAALKAAKEAELTVFFCYDAHLSVQTQKLLQLLQVESGLCLCVFLRSPWDEEYVVGGAITMKTFGFRAVQIRAAIDRICQMIQHREAQRNG